MHVTAQEYYLNGSRYDYPQYTLGQQGILPGEPYPTTESTDWGQNVVDLFKGYAEYETAQKCLDLNLIRAQQGQPPIDCSQYGAGVQVGITPQVQQTVLIAVGVLAAVYLLPRMLRGR